MSEAAQAPNGEHLARVKSALIAEAAGRAATRIEGLDGLFAVVDERWPVSHDNNKVVVTQPVAPETVLAFADDSLGGAGVAHRQVLAFEGGDEVAPVAREAGYTVETLVVMTLDPDFDQAPRPDVDVREIDEDALSGVLVETWSAGNPEMSEETVRQLVARRVAFDAPVTAFAAFAEGRPVAHLDLRRRDGVAEIDNVGTLPDHRNHGYARALVLHAIARARSQGDDLIFLLADAEDWPRELYAKLGFGVIGEIHELHRPIP